MLKFSIYYPFNQDVSFNYDYYLEKHIPLVKTELEDLGLEKLEVVMGQSGMMNKEPSFFAVANMYFEDAAAMANALKQGGQKLMEDLNNFTNSTPIQEISSIAVSE